MKVCFHHLKDEMELKRINFVPFQRGKDKNIGGGRPGKASIKKGATKDQCCKSRTWWAVVWLSWYSSLFQFQRSVVQIHSSAKIYIEYLLSTVLKRRKWRKWGREWPIFFKKQCDKIWQFLKYFKAKVLPSCHPGSTPKHTIYSFIIYS